MYKKLMTLFMICFIAHFSIGLADTATPLNRIVAIVNDDIITQSDLDTATNQLRQELTAKHIKIPQNSSLRQEALEGLINYRLQLQIAQRAEIRPTDEQVDQAIQKIAQANQLTTAQLKAQLTHQNITYKTFRKKIAEQLTITQLQQQMVAGQVKITDAEVAARLEKYKKTAAKSGREYHLVDFYFPLSEESTADEIAQALKQAQNIDKQIADGVDIKTIKPAYHDLGWRNSSNLPDIFANVLPDLTLKNASAPIRAANGYHVLKLLETRTGKGAIPTEAQVREQILREKYSAAIKTALDKARSEASVQIIPQ